MTFPRVALVVLILGGGLSSPVFAQDGQPLSGSKSYGGPQTISCLQGGAVIFQHVGVTRVRLEYNEAKSEISFRLPSGAKRKIDIIGGGLTCLIEEYGEESVPIKDRN